MTVRAALTNNEANMTQTEIANYVRDICDPAELNRSVRQAAHKFGMHEVREYTAADVAEIQAADDVLAAMQVRGTVIATARRVARRTHVRNTERYLVGGSDLLVLRCEYALYSDDTVQVVAYYTDTTEEGEDANINEAVQLVQLDFVEQFNNAAEIKLDDKLRYGKGDEHVMIHMHVSEEAAQCLRKQLKD